MFSPKGEKNYGPSLVITYRKGEKMNRFAFVMCEEGRIEFVIPEINLTGSEPTENIDDVLSLLVNRYNVTEFQVV